MILRPRLLRPALAADSASLCSRCLSKFGHPAARPLRRTLAVTAGRQSGTVGEASSFPKRTFRKEYFSSHQTLTENPVKKTLLSAWSKPKRTGESETAAISTPVPSSHSDLPADTPRASTATDTQEELPHRRRKRLKEEVRSDGSEQSLPLDASAQLSAISSALPNTSLRRKLAAYLALTKPRLSVLILLSTTSAYGLFPISTLLALDPSITQLPTLSTSTLTFLYLTAGTFLSCAGANTFNMILEPKFDARMSRTRNRPLVRGLVSRPGAILFAIATGVVGVGLLYVGTNPTVAALSGANILLYAFVYTPMKRIHVINTWVGAIVGAIPPMMGWVAAAGQTATTGHDTWRDMLFGEDSLGGWCLAALLFAWQFPHFNSLSHIIREEYKAAGHQMMAWVNPARNARVALRYSILMFPIAFGFWSAGVVNNWFLVSSTVANGWLVKEAYRFWKYQGAKGSARGLFWASVWQLPILLVGGLVTKRGVWDGVWRRIVGAPDDDDDEYIDEEEEAHHHRNVGISGSAASLPSVQSPA